MENKETIKKLYITLENDNGDDYDILEIDVIDNLQSTLATVLDGLDILENSDEVEIEADNGNTINLINGREYSMNGYTYEAISSQLEEMLTD